MEKLGLTSIFIFTIILSAMGQQPERLTGPIINDFGATFSVDQPDFITDTSMTYQVVFDIYNTPDDPSKVNPSSILWHVF